MRVALVVLPALLVTHMLSAEDEIKPITPAEALTKVDQKVTVEMEVKSSGGGNTSRYLNSLPDYKDKNNFTVVILRSDLAGFKKLGIEDPADFYKGKTIQVTGAVSVYKGQVQIKVTDPSQIKVIDKEAARPKAKAPAKAATEKSGRRT
jgi:DNA/RNA endonuclease YhcR with UshA esterase domain